MNSAAMAHEVSTTGPGEPQTTVAIRAGDPRSRPAGANRIGAHGQRLHERGEELGELRHLLSGSSGYPNCPIVIEGQVGTGRTALLNATLEMGRDLGLRVGRARCDIAESAIPFGVVRQLFSSMFRHQPIPAGPANDGTDLARRVLRGGLTAGDDPADAFYSLLLLAESVGDEPALLGVDDVRFADALSAAWLRYLARRLTTSSVHLVMTKQHTRADTTVATEPIVSHLSTRRFILYPLGIESMTAMMNQHLGVGIAPQVAARAHHATGGNPLLIVRMLTSLDEQGDSADTITEGQIDALASPAVARTVLSRVSMLAPGSLGLLEATAVLGVADLRVAAAVAGIENDEAGQLADELADVDLLGWGRPLEFVHPFERRSVYAAIKPTRRARLHEHAARAMADHGADALTIAAHLLESDPRGDDRTATTLVEAARHVLESGGAERAAQLLERADREEPQPRLRAEIARLRADVDGKLGRETAVEHLGRAARLGLDSVALAEAALDLLDRETIHSTCSAILGIALPAGDELAVRQPLTALRLQLAESVLVAPLGRVISDRAALTLNGELISSPSGRLIAAVRALRSAAHLECTHEQLIDTLRALLTPDLLCLGGLVHTSIIASSLGALVKVGAHPTAEPLIRAAITESNSAGRRLEADTYTLVLAESLAMQGRLVAAEHELASISTDGDDVVPQTAAMQARFFAALRERGHDALPRTPRPTAFVPGLAELGTSVDMVFTELTARVQLLEGDAMSALTNFDRLRSAAEQAGVRNPSFAPWRAGRCAALAALGRTKEGTVLAGENLQLARAFGTPIAIAEALACAARFQPAEAKARLLGEAIDFLAGIDAEVLRCNLLIDLGFARHYAGDSAAARSAFRDGADHAARLGVTRLAGLAGRGLLACGGRPRRLQTTGFESLTPAELRVVRLAADGHTNGSIAAELFVNLKTVESHLTRAYKKLGVTDRAELKTALASDDATEVDAAG